MPNLIQKIKDRVQRVERSTEGEDRVKVKRNHTGDITKIRIKDAETGLKKAKAKLSKAKVSDDQTKIDISFYPSAYEKNPVSVEVTDNTILPNAEQLIELYGLQKHKVTDKPSDPVVSGNISVKNIKRIVFDKKQEDFIVKLKEIFSPEQPAPSDNREPRSEGDNTQGAAGASTSQVASAEPAKLAGLPSLPTVNSLKEAIDNMPEGLAYVYRTLHNSPPVESPPESPRANPLSGLPGAAGASTSQGAVGQNFPSGSSTRYTGGSSLSLRKWHPASGSSAVRTEPSTMSAGGHSTGAGSEISLPIPPNASPLNNSFSGQNPAQ